jgi:hypothetical protein
MNAYVINLNKLGAPKVKLGSSSRRQHNDVSRKGEKAPIINSSFYGCQVYVGAYTKRKVTIRIVWVLKALPTNLKGPNSNWVPRYEA